MRMTPLDPWITATVGSRGQRLDRASLHRFQLARLHETVHLARTRSPFYRSLLSQLPPDPPTLQSLTLYPFTTPADVAAHGRQLVCVGQDEVSRVVTQDQPAELHPPPTPDREGTAALAALDSSGTTGPPKRLWFTASDQELTIDFFRVGMSTFTDPGDRVVILLPCERPGSVGDLLATALQRLGATPIRHGVVRDVPSTLAVLRQERPDVAVGIPGQVLTLARSDPGSRLRAVLLSTDHVPLSLARAISTAWGCAVFNHYGMTEMGLGGGVECEAHRGYHLREADLYVEIVDPATGDRLPDGECGEVVFTTLTRTGMPLIRYRTGDLSRFLPGPCPCGTGLRTLARITRRAAGVFRTSAGTELALADLDEVLFALPAVVDFDATVVRSAGGDRLQVEVRTVGPAPGARVPTQTQTQTQTVRDVLRGLPALAAGPGGAGIDVRARVVTASMVTEPVKRRMKVVQGNA